MNPRVSIVVPVYNCEEYLGPCLDSLLSQTLRNLEVIVVDDGSSDGSLKIAKSRAGEDSRVRVYSKANGGPGPARNLGLDQAVGDIIMWCDADDLFEPYACETVASLFDVHEPDVVVFGFEIDPPELMHPSLEGHLAPRDAVLGGSDEDHRRLCFEEDARPFAWRLALSRTFCAEKGIRWEPEVTLGDDQCFCFASLARSRKTVLTSRQLYRYRMTESSLTHAAQEGDEALLVKMEKHVRCEEAVLRDAEASGLLKTCPVELVDWLLDLMLFDSGRLSPEGQRAFWKGYQVRILDRIDFDAFRGRLPRTARTCIKEAGEVAQGRRDGISSRAIALFYLRRRGFSASVKRVLHAIASRSE